MEFNLSDLPDLSSMTPEDLRSLLLRLQDLYGEVETQEPKDEESEEYEDWLTDLEEIEDLMEEVTEQLEG